MLRNLRVLLCLSLPVIVLLSGCHKADDTADVSTPKGPAASNPVAAGSTVVDQTGKKIDTAPAQAAEKQGAAGKAAGITP